MSCCRRPGPVFGCACPAPACNTSAVVAATITGDSADITLVDDTAAVQTLTISPSCTSNVLLTFTGNVVNPGSTQLNVYFQFSVVNRAAPQVTTLTPSVVEACSYVSRNTAGATPVSSTAVLGLLTPGTYDITLNVTGYTGNVVTAFTLTGNVDALVVKA
jgi:hypothetical protein